MFVVMAAVATSYSCKNNNNDDDDDVYVDPGESTTELLAQKLTTPPNMDGSIDDMWLSSQRLVGTTEVPTLSNRGTYLNSDGAGIEENLGLFAPYNGETYDFVMRAGYTSTDIYFLLEWQDADDSRDRQSWYFDATAKRWKGEHKYANTANDKFYEDKFAFLWPIGTVTGFSGSTCYATCHQDMTIMNPKDKHSRHFLSVDGEKVDMWHWKRVRGTYLGQVDDQKMEFDDIAKQSAANGRKGDATGSGGYSNNSQDLAITGTPDMVSIPKYLIPNQTDYYWISQTEIDNGTAKLITAVDANGVLTYAGGTVDPSTGGYEQGTGNKRLPSVTTKAFTQGRGDISITALHTGSGWICEFTRKMDTGDNDDIVFDPATEVPFGLAIFNNAAIAHAIKSNLKLKFEE